MLPSTADIYDHHHQILQVCELKFRSFGARARFHGPCALVWTHEDHLPVLQAVMHEGHGNVLVVDGGGSLKIGIMGDRIGGTAAANGWAGVVINGVVRDTAGLNKLDIGIKALGATARRGWTPVSPAPRPELTFGGVIFRTGHWVYADEDCVLVSPHELDLSLVKAEPSDPFEGAAASK